MISESKELLAFDRPASLFLMPWPRALRLLMLAPHPDDFDSIGITMRFLHRDGHSIHLVVVSGSGSGVLDEFCQAPDSKTKADVREREPRESARFFGLPDERIEFMRLAEDDGGAPLENDFNERAIGARLAALRPQVVFLPHGSDTNAGHRRVYAMFSRAARSLPESCAAFLIRDPKTVDFRLDVFTPFDEEAARWKRQLLLHHRSQDHRNRLWRGHGFDDRILALNRTIAAELPPRPEYAEAFQIESVELRTPRAPG